LRQARDDAGLESIAYVARRCGCVAQQWRNYESGVSLPDIDRLGLISSVLKVDPGRILVAWTQDKLGADESSRDILNCVEHLAWPRSQNLDAKKWVQDLIDKICRSPLDRPTAELV